MRRRLLAALSASLWSLVVVACGGGGGTPPAAPSAGPGTERFGGDTSPEAAAKLAREAAGPWPGQVVGRWLDKETAFRRAVVFTQEGGRLYVTMIYTDGGRSRKGLNAFRDGASVRFAEEGQKLGDYWVIGPDGRLGWGDKKEGVWAWSEPIGAKP